MVSHSSLCIICNLVVQVLSAPQMLHVVLENGVAQVFFPVGFVSEGDELSAETVSGGVQLFSLNVSKESPMQISLANVRQPIVFKHSNKLSGSIISVSNILNFNEFEPTQGHLAIGANSQEITITWISNYTNDATARWGTTPFNLPHLSAATNTTYSITDMCASPANSTSYFLDPGTIFTATLTELPTGQAIFYSYGSPSKGWSPIYRFHVVPPTSTTLNFIAFGDLGVSPEQQPAILSTERMVQHLNETDLVVHIGDISYARGHAYLWEQFFNEIQPVATRVPYMTSIGNHEFDFHGQPFHPAWSTYGTDSGGECGVPFIARLPMPYINATPSFKNRTVYYSFNYGPVHFAMMDSESDFLEGSAQHAWLAQDLASVNRNITPFVIVTNHRPMYDSSLGGYLPEVAFVREAIEPLLVKYAVDVVLVGHVHVYQRSCRVVGGKCDNRGPVHMIIGMAGNISQGPWAGQPEWLKKRSLNHGIGLFSVANSTAMKVQFQRDTTGEIEDEFWIYR